jgi:raffinose/stachyose/melibiose transport system permease protein
MKWKLSKLCMTFFMMGMMIPIHATLIPLYVMFKNLGISNSNFALVLPYATFALPSTILILTGFFSSIPRELEEAAVIDGSPIWRVFVQIVIPISTPALMTVLIFNFISTWNELLVALVFIDDEKLYTLPVGLTNFVGQYQTNYAPMLAATMLSILPAITIYSAFNSKIVAGLTAGAIKG